MVFVIHQHELATGVHRHKTHATWKVIPGITRNSRKHEETDFQAPGNKLYLDPGGGYTPESLCKNSMSCNLMTSKSFSVCILLL